MTIANAVEKLRSITPIPTREEDSLLLPPRSSHGRDFQKVRDLIEQYDQKRYGMSLVELQEIVHSDALQRQFPERFGISFAEYAERFLLGESMGDALCGGIFQPAPPSRDKIDESANTSFVENLIGILAARLRSQRP